MMEKLVGLGYLSVEYKQDREDINMGLYRGDIDATTLLTGNLAQKIMKEDI